MFVWTALACRGQKETAGDRAKRTVRQRPEKPSWVVFLTDKVDKEGRRYGMNIYQLYRRNWTRRISGGESTKRQNGVE